jgi:hypothetical protein
MIQNLNEAMCELNTMTEEVEKEQAEMRVRVNYNKYALFYSIPLMD